MDAELEAELEALTSYFDGSDAEVSHRTMPGDQVEISLQVQLGVSFPFSVGREGGATAQVEHLPPATLRATVSPGYPEEPPRLELSCDWLSLRELSTLLRQLDQVMAENAGGSIVFQLACFLTSAEALVELQLPEVLVLNPLGGIEDHTILDLRARQECCSAAMAWTRLAAHTEQARARKFAGQLHLCGVCFEEVAGSKVVQLATMNPEPCTLNPEP